MPRTIRQQSHTVEGLVARSSWFADGGAGVWPSAIRNLIDAGRDAGGPSTPVWPALLGEMMGSLNRRSNGPASGEHQGHGAAADIPDGLMVFQHGYTLGLTNSIVAAGANVPLTFTITGPDNTPVTEYQVTHDQLLHLIAIRRDTTNFQHVHPVLAGDGTWSVPLDLSRAGEWRIFADFAPAGHEGSMTLGVDLAVTGMYKPQPLPPVLPIAEVDGYTVSMDGALMPGEPVMLTLSVHKDAQPVTDLQPYLAASDTWLSSVSATWPICTFIPMVSPVTAVPSQDPRSSSTPLLPVPAPTVCSSIFSMRVWSAPLHSRLSPARGLADNGRAESRRSGDR